MSKKKKVVVSTSSAKKPAQPRSQKSKTASAAVSRELTFGKETYIWMGIGFLLVVIGLALMTGGKMPNADVWDDDLIYSTRRTLIAPLVIIAGLVVEVYAIFKK